MIDLIPTTKGDAEVKRLMSVHYSKPKGFVGRQLLYHVSVAGVLFGVITAGSATLHLPGRFLALGEVIPLNNVVNNTFFHIHRDNASYPLRNFTSAVVRSWRERVQSDWKIRYGDKVLAFESLVEKPRTGELYLRDGWIMCGETKGYTCKRVSGDSTDQWSGKRVSNTKNLKPKLVFVRRA